MLLCVLNIRNAHCLNHRVPQCLVGCPVFLIGARLQMAQTAQQVLLAGTMHRGNPGDYRLIYGGGNADLCRYRFWLWLPQRAGSWSVCVSTFNWTFGYRAKAVKALRVINDFVTKPSNSAVGRIVRGQAAITRGEGPASWIQKLLKPTARGIGRI